MIMLTQSGYNQLKVSLVDLTEVKRPALVERLSLARSMGDLSENSDYQDAKESLSFMDGQIDELEGMLKNATVSKAKSNNEVGFGHAVSVQVGKTQAVFNIVGEWESNPAKKLISYTSPLGKALMGKKVGDKVEVEAPVGKVVYTVVAIS